MGAKENIGYKDERSMDLEKEIKTMKEGESDYEVGRNSISSQGDTQSSEDNKVHRASRVPKKINVKQFADGSIRTSQGGTDRREPSKLQLKTPMNGQKKSQKPNKVSSLPKNQADTKSESMKISLRPSSDRPLEQSDVIAEKTIEEVKEIDVLDEAPNCDQSVGTDDETIDTEENNDGDDRIGTFQKLEEMELKIEKLEGELREVAALEVSLYSVVPEHGCSAHKVHTPARRLSRLYIHACKYWSQNKRATVAKNSILGLVSVAKSCGTDVPRLTFWLSNMVVLRDIISHIFGTHNSSSIARASESNGVKKEGSPSLVKWKNNHSDKQTNGFALVGDWEETSTYTAVLEKLESRIFSRIVELVWWQALTPHMQSPVEELYPKKVMGKALDPIDDKHGNFSINLWNIAFQDAFSRLCPVRAGGHECGCLPVLARLVMEQCISRLDVAMFNAILRESENEMPTDPTSDPIVDSKVLPIPSGDLSFGSGAQLKNSIGNWSRWLSDKFGMDTDDYNEDQLADEGDHQRVVDVGTKSFRVLNELSDLLMLPKDMLINKAIRKEVCPSIGLPLITRVLCNFTPDEFCPDPVPGVVLDELNCESIIERRSTDRSLITSFPCPASPVVYLPPTASEVAEKVAEAGGKGEPDRRASFVQRKGYTSDDDLDDLYSPLTSIMDKTPLSSPSFGHETPNESPNGNARYRLLRDVWSG